MGSSRSRWAAFVVVLLTGLWLVRLAQADFVVAPNANTNTSGTTQILGPFQNGGITFQWVFPASQFASVPAGSPITSMGLRLPALAPGQPPADQTFTQWNLQLSRPTSPFPTLSSIFANNIGADVVLVRSGALTVPAGAFGGGANPNPFFHVAFTTPYVYQGTDLLVTLRHNGSNFIYGNDANGVGDGFGNTVLENSFTATSGTTNFFNYPITRFEFIPEPGAIMLLGIAGMALLRRSHGA